MKIQIIPALLLTLAQSAQAQLQSDQHWFYEHPQLGVEPITIHADWITIALNPQLGMVEVLTSEVAPTAWIAKQI